MASDAKAELYRFVKDRYDKFLTARAMAQTRLGHFLVVVGFLVTGLLAVGFPQLATVFDYANGGYRILAYVAGVAFLVTLIVLGFLLSELLQALGRFYFAIPEAKEENIIGCIDHKTIEPEFIYRGLAGQYLQAIRDIEVESGHVGKHFRRALRLNNAAMACGGAFLVCLLSARIAVSPATTQSAKVATMTDESQSGGNDQAAAPAPEPAPAAPPDAPPSLDMGIQRVTGGFDPAGIQIKGSDQTKAQ
jgi:hypothetical protein